MMSLSFNKNDERTMVQQIYEQIRGKILTGEIKGGQLLPSSRDLAGRYELPRALFVEVYRCLQAGGFIQGVSGSGTFACQGLLLKPRLEEQSLFGLHTEQKAGFHIEIKADCGEEVNQEWSKLVRRAMMAKPDAYSLQVELTKYWANARGVYTDPAQIISLPSDGAAFVSFAIWALEKHLTVWLDSELFPLKAPLFQVLGLVVNPLPRSCNSWELAGLERETGPALCIVQPQTVPGARQAIPALGRINLLQWARRTKSVVVEYEQLVQGQAAEIEVSPLRALDAGTFYLLDFSQVWPDVKLCALGVPLAYWAEFGRLEKLLGTASPLEKQVLGYALGQGLLEKRLHQISRRRPSRGEINGMDSDFISGDTTGSAGASDQFMAEAEKSRHQLGEESAALGAGAGADRTGDQGGNAEESSGTGAVVEELWGLFDVPHDRDCSTAKKSV